MVKQSDKNKQLKDQKNQKQNSQTDYKNNKTLKNNNKSLLIIVVIISIIGIILSYAAYNYFTPKQKRKWEKYQKFQEKREKELLENPQRQINPENELIKANIQYQYEIIDIKEQKPTKFTQGFGFYNETTILECTGGYGESFVYFIDRENLNITQSQQVEQQIFGEGCEFFDFPNQQDPQKTDRLIYYLTWQNRKVIILNDNLNILKTIDMPEQINEGWGLTKYYSEQDQKWYFLVTEGSDKLFFIDINTFSIVKTLNVYIQNTSGNKYKLTRLNEIEVYKDNSVLINIFMTTQVVQVDLETGQAFQVYDFKNLNEKVDEKMGIKNYYQTGMGNCLNGIAYDQQKDQLLLTGKKWPFVFEIAFHKNF